MTSELLQNKEAQLRHANAKIERLSQEIELLEEENHRLHLRLGEEEATNVIMRQSAMEMQERIQQQDQAITDLVGSLAGKDDELMVMKNRCDELEEAIKSSRDAVHAAVRKNTSGYSPDSLRPKSPRGRTVADSAEEEADGYEMLPAGYYGFVDSNNSSNTNNNNNSDGDMRKSSEVSNQKVQELREYIAGLQSDKNELLALLGEMREERHKERQEFMEQLKVATTTPTESVKGLSADEAEEKERELTELRHQLFLMKSELRRVLSATTPVAFPTNNGDDIVETLQQQQQQQPKALREKNNNTIFNSMSSNLFKEYGTIVESTPTRPSPTQQHKSPAIAIIDLAKRNINGNSSNNNSDHLTKKGYATLHGDRLFPVDVPQPFESTNSPVSRKAQSSSKLPKFRYTPTTVMARVPATHKTTRIFESNNSSSNNNNYYYYRNMNDDE